MPGEHSNITHKHQENEAEEKEETNERNPFLFVQDAYDDDMFYIGGAR